MNLFKSFEFSVVTWITKLWLVLLAVGVLVGACWWLVSSYPVLVCLALGCAAASLFTRRWYLILLGAAAGGALVGAPAALVGAPVDWRLWLTLQPLAGWDLYARYGLYTGACAGLLFALAGRGGVHDERHVHGLKVATGHPEAGTSRWAGFADVTHVCEFGPPAPRKGGTVLGKMRGQVVRAVLDRCRPPLPAHALVVAGTGAGKTFSFVIPNAVAAAMEGESLVLTDPKGELACLLAPWLREKGYEVYLFNLAYPQWSSCWNPVLECRDDEEITAFATAIVQNAAKDKSGYFVMKEIQLLKALVYLLQADFPEEQAHLRSALSLLSWPLEALDARFEAAYRAGRLPQSGYEEWRGAVSSNYENAVSGLSAKLNVIRSEGVAKLLSRQEIDLSAIGREKAALFCVLPVNAAHLKPVLATFYYFFFRRLYGLAAESGGRLPNPTRFLLDEFANVGQVPGFVEVISTARSLGIKIQFVLQGLKQLQDVYGDAEKEAILSNCPIQLFLGGDDATTTRYFSSRLGEAAVYAQAERKDATLPGQKHFTLARRTEGVKRRALMEPEELSRMDPMAAVALIRWCLPLYLEKLGWTELPQAKEIQTLAARTLADVCPERGDIKVELPEVPEAQEEPERPRRSRDSERGGGRRPPEPDEDVEDVVERFGI
ncbi:type IV secretion system protein VirD4 [Thermodesulfitimonas autotrophica]|uniref:Type IV secretion system protein VirD4 n=1 Tax=Thermodesulfitimonas autotrophica TaxID=1894989 RepID=A0A3N5BD89_9THEO|nr:type IV secretory system conjugative DNA transfer family protein [Thermodesulfitimonas autotrophica]RPF42001.1 type IV secretion system protein VirD4 [Thermodesulfitimonas autotrophica]